MSGKKRDRGWYVATNKVHAFAVLWYWDGKRWRGATGGILEGLDDFIEDYELGSSPLYPGQYTPTLREMDDRIEKETNE